MVRSVSSHIAKISIGANADFKFLIKLPRYPIEVAQIVISSTQNLEIGGSLFNKLRVIDDKGGGEHKEAVDLDGALSLGGIADTSFEFFEDQKFSGKNLDATTAKVLIQFLVVDKR